MGELVDARKPEQPHTPAQKHQKPKPQRPLTQREANELKDNDRVQASKQTNEATNTITRAADILTNNRAASIASAPPAFAPALWTLYAAVTGRSATHLDAKQRLASFDTAASILKIARDRFAHTHATNQEGLAPESVAEQAEWLKVQFDEPMIAARNVLAYNVQSERVDKGMSKTGPAFDAEKLDARAAAGAVRERALKLTEMLATLNEWVMTTHEHAVDHALEQLLESELPHSKFAALPQLAGSLQAIAGLLVLTDEELLHHVGHINGVADGISTISELLKGAVSLVGGSLSVVAKLTSVGFKLAGNGVMSLYAAGVAAKIGNTIGTVLSAFEIVHGVALVFGKDPHKRLDGAVEVTSGSLMMAGKIATKVGTVGAGVAMTSAGVAVAATYGMVKGVAALYWGASVGMSTGLMSPALEALRSSGNGIAAETEALALALKLQAEEKDGEASAQLDRVVSNRAHQLSAGIDGLIEKCSPTAFEAGIAAHPGAHRVLREMLAPLNGFKGVSSPPALLGAAVMALEKLGWIFAHVTQLAEAVVRRESAEEVRERAVEEDKEAKEGE